MLDNEPRTVDEAYQTASNTSDLSVDADKRQSADVLIAAGMSESRLGMALLRLVSEWDAAAKPRKLTDGQIFLLANRLKADNDTARVNRERENGELDRLRAKLEEAEEAERFDLLVAIKQQQALHDKGALPLPAVPPLKDPLGRARVEAVLWYARELRLLAQGLRSRGVVMAQVRAWALGKGIDADYVGPAIFHWLSPTCPVCDGHGMRKIPDAPALSAKRCHACDAGKVRRPEGSTRIQNHLDHAVSVARASLKKRLRG